MFFECTKTSKDIFAECTTTSKDECWLSVVKLEKVNVC